MAKIVLTSFYNECCPGLRYLKSFLQSKGHECRLVILKVYGKVPVNSAPLIPRYTEVHEVFENDGWYYLSYSQPPSETEWELWLEQVSGWNPDLVCMSVLSSNIRTASESVKRLREKSPDVPVIWGGAQPTVDPKGSLEHCDFVCIGEGENTLADIAEFLDKNKPLHTINNLAYKGEDNDVIVNPLYPLITDTDSLPFPDFDPETTYYIDSDTLYRGEFPPTSQHQKSYMIISARGCPFDCSFCINSTYNDLYKGSCKVRRRSVENVIKELQEVKKRWGDIYIQVEDEIFTLDKDWIRKFSEEYRKKIRLPFWCYTHAGTCNEEMINLLKDAGLRYIIMGIQSGSERINRDIYNRKTSNKKILETLNMLDSMNVITSCDLLTNNPFESEEDRISTFELLRKCPSRILLCMGKLIVYPETSLHKMMEDMPYPPEVDETLYRFWNSLYVIALYDKPDDEESKNLLENMELRNNPPELEEKAMKLLKDISQKTEARFYEREDEVKRNLEQSEKSSGIFKQFLKKISLK